MFRIESKISLCQVLIARQEPVRLIECQGLIFEASNDLYHNEGTKSADQNPIGYGFKCSTTDMRQGHLSHSAISQGKERDNFLTMKNSESIRWSDRGPQ